MKDGFAEGRGLEARISAGPTERILPVTHAEFVKQYRDLIETGISLSTRSIINDRLAASGNLSIRYRTYRFPRRVRRLNRRRYHGGLAVEDIGDRGQRR